MSEPIKLTAEQVTAIVGHGATQEQLDGVRRELNAHIESVRSESNLRHDRLDGRLDKLDAKLDAKIDKLDAKIDSTAKSLRLEIHKLDNRLWWLAGLIVTLAFKSEIFAFFQPA